MHTTFNILYALFIALLLVVGGLFLVSFVRVGAVELKIVQSGSMEPSIPLGALVLIKPAAVYVAGDIITFTQGSEVVPTTHRIVSLRQEGNTTSYTTKGDANEEADPREVAGRDIVGKVVLSLPFAGFVLDFARQPLGFLLLIVFPALLIVLEELVAIVREIKKIRRRKVTALPHLAPAYRVGDEIWIRAPAPLLKSTRKAYAGALSILCVACASLGVFSGGIPGTVSYFNDTEQSLNNSFTAGVWEPQLVAPPIVEEEPPPEESLL